MRPLTQILSHTQVESVILAGCISVVGLSMTALWLLARPTSWLSKRIDRAVTLPAQERTVR